MLEQLKWYIVNVGVKKYAPVGLMAAMTSLGTLMAAHEGMLEQWGVNYIASWSPQWLSTHAISGPIILIELDTTSTAVLAGVIALIAVMSRMGEHHTTGTPAVPGGQRASDPPAVDAPQEAK